MIHYVRPDFSGLKVFTEGKMRFSMLGKTGIKVSRMCFGTLTLGPLQANLPLEDGASVMAHAIGAGVNFCDTAQLYKTYQYIRRAMELSGKTDLVIATKTYAYTRELAKSAVEDARRGLDRDYIDIFMLHEQESIHTLNGHASALEYLLEQKQKGVIKAVGASMHHVAAVYGAIEKELDVIHPLLNLSGLGIVDGTREDMEKAVKFASLSGTGVFGMKALGGGNLFKDAAACLQYALSLDFLDSVAIGMQSVEEVEANLTFWEKLEFSAESKQILSQKTRRLHIDSWCGGCGKCAEKCGQRAISVVNGKAVCEHKKCLLCGYCSSVCPEWAIKVV